MATPSKTETEKIAPIIIKRVKKVSGAHHGGAWKVAYADFVTAMMAFFLLLWLLNVTTADQKNSISNYFDPSHPQISSNLSGSGGIMGGTAMSSVGAMATTVQAITRPDVPNTSKAGAEQGENLPSEVVKKDDLERQKIQDSLKKEEEKKFEEIKNKIEAELEKTPELKDLKKNLLIDITPEGLRIQIVDDQGRSMFASGSAQMYPFMERLLVKVSEVIKVLPNLISVRGHTDGAPYKTSTGYDNWNLSADRALATRHVLIGSDRLEESRIANVVGRADKEHLDTNNPLSTRNRRVSIILLRTDYADMAKIKQTELMAKQKTEQQGLKLIQDTPAIPLEALNPDIPIPAGAKPKEITPEESGQDITDKSLPKGQTKSVPDTGLAGKSMLGAGTSSKRGPILIIDDTVEQAPPEPKGAPVFDPSDVVKPTKVLEF